MVLGLGSHGLWCSRDPNESLDSGFDSVSQTVLLVFLMIFLVVILFVDIIVVVIYCYGYFDVIVVTLEPSMNGIMVYVVKC